jgi:hypothetical protein
MHLLNRAFRLLRVAAVAEALLIGAPAATYAQTTYCSLCCQDCFIYAYGSCSLNCPCYVGLPPQNGNAILI